jgi:hypothetical protein
MFAGANETIRPRVRPSRETVLVASWLTQERVERVR